MNRTCNATVTLLICGATLLMGSEAVHAQAEDPCTKFAWDVSNLVTAFRAGPAPLTSGTEASSIPTVDVGKAYELALAAQDGVKFLVAPGKPTLADGSHAGLLRFQVPAAGRYRVGITTGHWLDIVDGDTILESRDFNGNFECAAPRKTVEYELPAGRDLVLQLSGGTEATVGFVVDAALGDGAAHPH